MKTSFFICFFFLSMHVMGQSKSIAYEDCAPLEFCLDCGDVKASYSSAESLQEYFAAKLNKKILEGIKGLLFLQVIVDDKGNVCCKFISNLTNAPNEAIQDLRLNKHIQNMNSWTPAQNKGVAEASSITLKMTLAGTGEFTVERYQLGPVTIIKKTN